MPSHLDNINSRSQDSNLMTPEFTLINNRNLDWVYVLFLENENEIINQISKEQQTTKVFYLLDQLPELYIANIVSLWWNFVSHCRQCKWIYYANIWFKRTLNYEIIVHCTYLNIGLISTVSSKPNIISVYYM